VDNQTNAAAHMLRRYLAEPTSIWLYSDLSIEERMAWAYLTADEFMKAPYEGDQVRRFVTALKQVIVKPEDFWSQVRNKDEAREQYLRYLSWSLEKIPLKDMGVYPQFGGFPLEWGHGTVLDTARALATGVTEAAKRHSVLSMTDQWMTVLKFLPPILVQGGILRGKHPTVYTPTKWDIDDGNHRLVAAAIGGAREAICFVGKRRSTDSSLRFLNTTAVRSVLHGRQDERSR
jgi:hypothetical protein